MKNVLLTLSLAATALTSQTQAQVNVMVREIGNAVVVAASGPTLNLSGLTADSGNPSTINSWYLLPDNSGEGLFALGASARQSADQYTGVTGPGPFGTSTNLTFADSGTGDPFGILNGNTLMVPPGYSGGSISATGTFNSSSFVSLGLTPGNYLWTWGTGMDQRVRMQIIVPEPSTYALLVGLGVLGFACYRRWR